MAQLTGGGSGTPPTQRRVLPAESAWVLADLECPGCSMVLVNVVWFSWGGMLSDDQTLGPLYAPGKHLLWYSDRSGYVHADAWLSSSRGVNVGDPRAIHVDVYETRGVPRACPACTVELFGSRVSLRDGAITRVEAVVAGQHDENIHAVEVDPIAGEVVRTFDAGRQIVMMTEAG